jgi:hypothetical protein
MSLDLEDVQLEGMPIELDGARLLRCTLKECVLVYAGGAPPILDSCTIDTNCKWIFKGAAANTVSLMQALYAAGAGPLIEATFENIRGQAAKGGLTIQ